MKTNFLLAVLVVCACEPLGAATPLTESVFTEIIREANVVAATSKSATPAVTNMVFHAPDLVRTGPASRVEMTAPDQTITRVGANTVLPSSRADGMCSWKRAACCFIRRRAWAVARSSITARRRRCWGQR